MSAKIRFPKDTERLGLGDLKVGDIIKTTNSKGIWQVTSGFAMYDAIKACVNPITITAYGCVMSMASAILQAADVRIMGRSCRMMIHRGETALDGEFNTVKKAMQEQLELDKMLCDVYFEKMTDKNPDYKRAALEKLMDTDSYFSAEKALELGLIDEIEGDE